MMLFLWAYLAIVALCYVLMPRRAPHHDHDYHGASHYARAKYLRERDEATS